MVPILWAQTVFWGDREAAWSIDKSVGLETVPSIVLFWLKTSASLWPRVPSVCAAPSQAASAGTCGVQEGGGGGQPHHGDATASETSFYGRGWLKETEDEGRLHRSFDPNTVPVKMH